MAKANYVHVKAWRSRPENKPKRAAEARRWRAKHPEIWRSIKQRHRRNNLARIRASDAAAKRNRRAADPEGQRIRMKRFKAKQEALLVSMAGRARPAYCELCGEETSATAFDHCHASGKFRGWLCQRCNRTLGQVKDSVHLLEKMIRYLNDGGIGYGKINDGTTKANAIIQFRAPG